MHEPLGISKTKHRWPWEYFPHSPFFSEFHLVAGARGGAMVTSSVSQDRSGHSKHRSTTSGTMVQVHYQNRLTNFFLAMSRRRSWERRRVESDGRKRLEKGQEGIVQGAEFQTQLIGPLC